MRARERLFAHVGGLLQRTRRFFSHAEEPGAVESLWWRYGVAVLSVILAAVARVMFFYSGSAVPYLCFYPVMVLVSLYLGYGPGVLAVCLSTLLTMIWLEPVGRLSVVLLSDQIALVVFFVTGLLLVWVCERLRRTLARAQKAEETLSALHRKETSELLENISDGFVSLDRQWRFSYVNSGGSRLLHKPKEQMLGNVVWDVFPTLADSVFGREYRRAMDEQVAVNVQGFYGPLNAWFEARCYPASDGLCIFFDDLTERKRVQDALKREQDFNRALVENMVDGVVACDENFHLTLMNRTAREWQEGVDLSVPSEKWAEFYRLYNEDGVTLMAPENVPLARTFHNERLYNAPMMIRTEGMPPRYVLASGAPFFDENGHKRGAVVVLHDITDRKLVEQNLHRLNRLYAVLSQVNQAVVRCVSREDLFQQICQVAVDFGGFQMAWIGKIDPATQRVVPVASAGDKGRYLERIAVYADERPEGRGPVGKAIRSGKANFSNDFAHDPDAIPWRKAAREEGFLGCVALPLYRQGKIFGTLAVYAAELDLFHEKEVKLLEEVASDVSFALDHLEQERRRREDEVALIQAKEAAEAASRAKDQFIAVLSHELRTPLTPALTAISLMQASREWDDDDKEQIEMIRRNVELEASLIDDLLDVTRISRGVIELRLEEVDVHACLRKALEICRDEIATKNLKCTVALEASKSEVWADSARLQQVFWNLIKNAVKFTPAGGHIGIRSTNANGRIHIEISDTGIGIEAEMLSRIFNAFEQGEQTRSRRFGGLGLGLCIAKNVVELHHGRLAAFSDGHNKGAVFTVELDLIPPGQTPCPAAAAALPPREKGQLKILLVEDHFDTLRVLSRLLERWGYEVKCADRVARALELAEREPFDLLVSDIGLPDGDGLGIMRQVRARYGIRGIALSGFGTEEDLRQSRAAGFEEHLTKPVAMEALHAAVERLAAARQGREAKT